MKTRFLVLAMVPAVVLADASYDGLIRRYERQIKQQEKQLSSLKVRLAEKERDAARWQSKAEEAKTMWNQLGQSADRARQSLDSVHQELKKARTLAQAAEMTATENALVARSSDAQLAYLTRQLYEDRMMRQGKPALTVTERYPEYVAGRLCDFSKTSHEEAVKASAHEAALRMEELKWQGEESQKNAELEKLRTRQQGHWLKWQEALRRKTALEEEKIQMEQSEQALNVMLKELRDHRERAVAARQGRRGLPESALASLKGTLPWPAYGRVTQNFGRQYSKELQQLLVSNGIKIEAGGGKTVRAIQPGRVLFASPFRQYGQLVIVQHRSGLTSVYGGLGTTQVQEGTTLAALDAVGTVADSGSFYFELRRDEQPINPLVYLTAQHPSELSSRRTFK